MSKIPIPPNTIEKWGDGGGGGLLFLLKIFGGGLSFGDFQSLSRMESDGRELVSGTVR